MKNPMFFEDENGVMYYLKDGIYIPIQFNPIVVAGGGGRRGARGPAGADAAWIFAGSFPYTAWQPSASQTSIIDVANIPANYIVTGVAIKRLAANAFTADGFGGGINLTVLPSTLMSFLSPQLKPSPTVELYIYNQAVGSNAAVDLYRYCAGWNPVVTADPDGGGFFNGYNWQSAYTLQAKLEKTGEGSIDDLTAGLVSIWYKIELIPASA